MHVSCYYIDSSLNAYGISPAQVGLNFHKNISVNMLLSVFSMTSDKKTHSK